VIAGVGLPDGRLLWVRTDLLIEPLDRVIVALSEGEVEGIILVAPDQLRRSPEASTGELVRLLPRLTPDPACEGLPGADLPPLGACVCSGTVTGHITTLDPVARTVRIAPDNGSEPFEVSVADAAPEPRG
jgi:hypothetical protein